MEITGIRHHENLWSDIYKFFFEENEEHNLGDLFIRSLESTIGLKSNFLESFSVEREYVVDEKKRIDILLYDNWNHRAIIIENKVKHVLDNDLNVYYETVVENGYNDVLVVVLGLKKYNLNTYEKASIIPNDKMFSITHFKLIGNIERKMNLYYRRGNPQYLYLFQEFAKNVINYTNEMNMNTEELNFYFSGDNRSKINKLSKIRNTVIDYLSNSIQEKDVLEPLFKKYGLDLEIGKNAKEYIYYPYRGYDGRIMITLIYNQLWNQETLGCKMQVILELQGEMIKWVMKNYKGCYNSMAGLDKEDDYWHYYSCEVYFDVNELVDDFQENLCKKLSNDRVCPVYKIGKDILEQYENNK